MSIFGISFRIHEDATYAERYESLVEAIKMHANGKYWDETTSFVLIENLRTANELGAGIQRMSSISTDRDLVLVINLSRDEYYTIGKVSDRDISVLMERR